MSLNRTSPFTHPSAVRAQEGALTALASVADCSQEYFVKYYDAVMPQLKQIMVAANVGCGGEVARWVGCGPELSRVCVCVGGWGGLWLVG